MAALAGSGWRGGGAGRGREAVLQVLHDPGVGRGEAAGGGEIAGDAERLATVVRGGPAVAGLLLQSRPA